ncbi:MAG: integration host factor subunit beta [Aquificae bacterium]|nr:integration host factor subunit beta [Aquificota bacterium]
MKKSDIIETISKEMPFLSKKTVSAVVNGTFEAMIDALSKGERIEIRGLGSFRVRSKPERIVRNPRTGERVKIPPRKLVHFKVGKLLKAQLSQKK